MIPHSWEMISFYLKAGHFLTPSGRHKLPQQVKLIVFVPKHLWRGRTQDVEVRRYCVLISPLGRVAAFFGYAINVLPYENTQRHGTAHGSTAQVHQVCLVYLAYLVFCYMKYMWYIWYMRYVRYIRYIWYMSYIWYMWYIWYIRYIWKTENIRNGFYRRSGLRFSISRLENVKIGIASPKCFLFIGYFSIQRDL